MIHVRVEPDSYRSDVVRLYVSAADENRLRECVAEAHREGKLIFLGRDGGYLGPRVVRVRRVLALELGLSLPLTTSGRMVLKEWLERQLARR